MKPMDLVQSEATRESQSEESDAWQELGNLLQKARHRVGLSITELATQTKIPQDYLVAFERGDADALPQRVYIKGFLKILAKTLRGDAAKWQSYLPSENQKEIISSPVLKKANRLRILLERRRALFLRCGILVLVLVVGLGVYFLINALSNQKSSMQDHVQLKSGEVNVHIKNDTNLEIKVDSKDWAFQEIEAGVYRVHFDKVIMVKSKDTKNIKVMANDELIPLQNSRVLVLSMTSSAKVGKKERL